MPNSYDYKKFAVLYVDDEDASLLYFKKVFEPSFRVMVATNADKGFRILSEYQDEIGLLMSDERMPGEGGVALLQRARELCPRTVRVLVTAYSDFAAAIQAVNEGAIYRYVSKPWNVANLEAILRRGLEFFMVQRERDQLLQEKITVLREFMISDRLISLGILSTGLSHHMRNALVAIRTFVDLAPTKLGEENLDLEKLRHPEFWKGFRDLVTKEVGRITEMLEGLETIADRSSVSCFQTINVSETLTNALTELNPRLEEKQIKVELALAEPLHPIEADRKKIDRLFKLIFIDELAHLPPGSRIRVRARSATESNVQIPEVILEIQDDGPGLPEEMLRSVFDPFFIRRDIPPEHGLNLLTCWFLSHHHGGRIDVRNLEPRGTLFTIALPVKPNPPRPYAESGEFLRKLRSNESVWERLLSGK